MLRAQWQNRLSPAHEGVRTRAWSQAAVPGARSRTGGSSGASRIEAAREVKSVRTLLSATPGAVEVEESRRGLQDHDTTVLLGVVVTPIVGIRGPTQLPGVESEGCCMRSVRVGLHDVPGKDAEHDAVARPGTDPPRGADGAPRSGMWQRARDVVADGP